jgi:SAM-dependent methyltransferase
MPLSALLRRHLDDIASFFDKCTAINGPTRHYRSLLAGYYARLIPATASVLEIGCGGGNLLAALPNRDVTGVDISPLQLDAARTAVPHGHFQQQAGEELILGRTFDVIIISETLNYAADVQALLTQLRAVSNPHTRLHLNFYNGLWRPLIALGCLVGIKSPTPQSNWLSPKDVNNLLDLAGWDVITAHSRLICPLKFPVVEPLLNRFIAPLLPWFCLTHFASARPVRDTIASDKLNTVTVVVPARNEAGNMSVMLERIPEMGGGTEIIFVEGGSKDNTWEEIQKIIAEPCGRRVFAIQQTGHGKGNAVREGFTIATGDILMILDADLTMPPEDLPKFYQALASGKAEFANGCRLVYPMEKQAMQFFNLCANKFFGLAFSWLLGQPLKDTLCGTKALKRIDYDKIAANRAYFGDFDPFGDFDLLFGAAHLNMKIADIPIRYRERTYGATNIQRWKHGLLLFRMLAFAAKKLKFI